MKKSMAKRQKNSASIIASCADYDTEAEEEVAETRKLANVSHKRSSHSSGLADMPSAQQQSGDVASDSGYSSRTQATAASADSVASIKAKATTNMASQQDTRSDSAAAPGPSSRRRTTTDSASESQETQRAPQRAASTRVKKKVVQCTDPNCGDERCRGRKPRVSISTNTSPNKSPDKSPVKAASATSSRAPRGAEYPQRPQATPLVQTQQRRQRPTSMYELQPHMMMPPPGPPPTHYNTRGGYPYSAGPGPAPVFGQGPLAIIERPGLVTRRTDMSARTARPVSIHGPQGLVSYNPNAGKTLSARRPTKPSFPDPGLGFEEDQRRQQPAEEDFSEDDEGDSEEESEDDEQEAIDLAAFNRQLQLDDNQRKVDALRMQQAQMRQQRPMPPPNFPASAVAAAAAAAVQGSAPKISMRKPGPAPHITYGRRPSEHLDDNLRAFREQTQAAVGSSQLRRPSLVSNGGVKATSYPHPTSTGNVGITVEGQNRRMSYQGGEDHARMAEMRARFQQPAADPFDFSKMVGNIVSQELRKLQLQPAETARSRLDLDSRMRDAMAYQSRTDQSAPRGRDELGELPQGRLTKSALRRRSGLPSHTGSSRSNRSSEEGTRISNGHRITTGSELGNVTVNGDETKMRFDLTNGFEMEFEGRRVMLNPIGDGTTAELIIGGKRESSTTYVSTRGSTATRSQVGSRLTRTPSQRDQRVREREQRDRRERQDRDRARYEEEEEEEDRRTARASSGRRRAETYDSEYHRTGQMSRTISREDPYPQPSSYTRSSQYVGPGFPGYNGFPLQHAYPPGYGRASQGENLYGA